MSGYTRDADERGIREVPAFKLGPVSEDSPDAGYERYGLDWQPVHPDESPITTGELRSMLQPTVFLRLIDDQGPFTAGTLVAAQYWGAGKVVLTRYPDGKRYVPVAHEVRATRA